MLMACDAPLWTLAGTSSFLIPAVRMFISSGLSRNLELGKTKTQIKQTWQRLLACMGLCMAVCTCSFICVHVYAFWRLYLIFQFADNVIKYICGNQQCIFMEKVLVHLNIKTLHTGNWMEFPEFLVQHLMPLKHGFCSSIFSLLQGNTSWGCEQLQSKFNWD